MFKFEDLDKVNGRPEKKVKRRRAWMEFHIFLQLSVEVSSSHNSKGIGRLKSQPVRESNYESEIVKERKMKLTQMWIFLQRNW